MLLLVDSHVLFNNTFFLRLGPVVESLGVRDLRGLFLSSVELIPHILDNSAVCENFISLMLKLLFNI